MEFVEGRNTRSKKCHRKLRYGDDQVLPSVDPDGTFVGLEVPVLEAAIKRFCAVTGDEQVRLLAMHEPHNALTFHRSLS